MKKACSSLFGLMMGLTLCVGPGAGIVHALPPAFPPADVEGDWMGTLKVPGVELRVVFHITRDSTGTLTATLDSPDQGAFGIPVDAVTATDDSLHMTVGAVGGSYKGKLSDDGTAIDGQWTQGGQTFPLVMERTDDEEAAAKPRPQEPQPPYPYNEESVSFSNPDAGVTLAGTLTTPRADGPFPAVVLISGSGPQDRDEALLGHRPFLVLADYLTRRGIAVLRYDDRGVAASTGDFSKATSEDFADDALAAVAYLQTRAEVDAAKIGLVGHSEGGLIAPIVAVQSADVAFIVLMAGPGLTGEEILYLQSDLISRADSIPEAIIARSRRQQEQFYAVLKAEPDSAAAAEQLRALAQEAIAALSEEEKQEAGIAGVDEAMLIDRQVRQLNTPWFRYFLTYDPVPTLREVTCPVLAINGEKDLQVPPKENLHAIEAALREGGNDAVTVVELEGLNHLFQTAETGSPSEYAGIEETFSPQAMTVIGDWITQQTKEE